MTILSFFSRYYSTSVTARGWCCVYMNCFFKRIMLCDTSHKRHRLLFPAELASTQTKIRVECIAAVPTVSKIGLNYTTMMIDRTFIFLYKRKKTKQSIYLIALLLCERYYKKKQFHSPTTGLWRFVCFFFFFILRRIISLYLKHYQQIVCHQSYIVNRIQLKNVVHVSNCRRHLVGRFGIRLVVGTSRKMFRSYPLDESRRRMDWIRWWRIHQSIR
jgi:hypothetical protein